MNTLIKTGFGLAGAISAYLFTISMLAVSRWSFPDGMYSVGRLGDMHSTERVMIAILMLAFFCSLWSVGVKFTDKLIQAGNKVDYVISYIKRSVLFIAAFVISFIAVSYLQLGIDAYVSWNHEVLLLNETALMTELTSAERTSTVLASAIIALGLGYLVSNQKLGVFLGIFKDRFSEVFEGSKKDSEPKIVNAKQNKEAGAV